MTKTSLAITPDTSDKIGLIGAIDHISRNTNTIINIVKNNRLKTIALFSFLFYCIIII
jgi:hypothetical protein